MTDSRDSEDLDINKDKKLFKKVNSSPDCVYIDGIIAEKMQEDSQKDVY